MRLSSFLRGVSCDVAVYSRHARAGAGVLPGQFSLVCESLQARLLH